VTTITDHGSRFFVHGPYVLTLHIDMKSMTCDEQTIIMPSVGTREREMNIDRIVMAFAGIVILAGTALGYAVHPYWLALPAFVGLNLLQAAFSGFCPLAKILRAAGMKPGRAFP